jgi:hypothetical protein
LCTGWHVNLERCDKLQIRWHRGVARSPRFGTASKGPCRPIAEGRHRGRADISRRSPPARKSYPADNIPTTPRPMMVAASDHQIGASPGATRPARVCTLGTNQNQRRGAASTATTATDTKLDSFIQSATQTFDYAVIYGDKPIQQNIVRQFSPEAIKLPRWR